MKKGHFEKVLADKTTLYDREERTFALHLRHIRNVLGTYQRFLKVRARTNEDAARVLAAFSDATGACPRGADCSACWVSSTSLLRYGLMYESVVRENFMDEVRGCGCSVLRYCANEFEEGLDVVAEFLDIVDKESSSTT